MRKLRFFVAIGVLVLSTSISVANITPRQLKEARKSVYEWVNDYDFYSLFADGEYSRQKFCELFDSLGTEVFNDFLPNQTASTVGDYASTIVDAQSQYNFSFSMDGVGVDSESIISNGNYRCVLHINRTVSCNLIGDSTYYYPPKKYSARIELVYSFADKKIECQQITSDDDLHIECILHTDSTNSYINYSDTVSLLRSGEICLISQRLKYAAFDRNFVSVVKDTLKNNIHIGGQVGVALFSAGNVDDNFTNLLGQTGFCGGVTLGFYRQLSLKDRNRLGLDFSVRYTQQNVDFTGEYHDSFTSIDPDGGQYIRKTDILNYKESIKRSVVEIPIAVRCDRFVSSKKNLSLYGKLGVCVAYDVMQKTVCQADAQYSGYYDWLFDVTISQNGIYDFGNFNLAQSAKKTSIKQLGYGGMASLGMQWFPIPKLSIEGGIEYCAMYHSVTKADDFRFSLDSNHWNSATGLFKHFLSHTIALQITLNYNF